jgi:hypothetical protein
MTNSSTVNTSCTITNSSGDPVVVLNAFNSSTNVANNSTQQGYMQQLETLALASGNSILANAQTDAITLNETYVDSKGQTQPSYIYDLLVSQPSSLFPVMAIGKSLDFSTMSYPPITVTAAAAANMTKALTFCENLMTSPSSQMATGFQTAMTNAFSSQSSVAGINQAMAAFFNQYPTFAGLDFPSYIAVSTWLKGFAYIWGIDATKRTPGTTLYLYSAGEAGKSGATSEGSIVFTQTPKSPADPTDRQSGYTITLTPSSGPTSTLTFQNGQVIDSAGGAVALNCTFGFAGTFTGKNTDTTVWPILVGTMVNKQVMAIPLSPESGWDKFLSGLSIQKLLTYFLEGMGVWMALDFLKTKLTGKEKKLADDQANENNGGEPNQQQVDEANADGEAIGNQALAENQQLVDNVAPGGNVQVPANDQQFNQQVDQVRGEGQDAYNQVAEENIQGGIDNAQVQLDDLAQIEVNPAIEEAEGNLVNAQESLNEGNLSAANESLGQVTEALPEIVQDMGSAVSQELKDQIAEGVEVQEEASEIAEETSENAEDTGSGEGEPFEEPFE